MRLIFVTIFGGRHVFRFLEYMIEMRKGKIAEAIGNFQRGKVGVFQKVAGVFYFCVAKKRNDRLSRIFFEQERERGVRIIGCFGKHVERAREILRVSQLPYKVAQPLRIIIVSFIHGKQIETEQNQVLDKLRFDIDVACLQYSFFGKKNVIEFFFIQAVRHMRGSALPCIDDLREEIVAFGQEFGCKAEIDGFGGDIARRLLHMAIGGTDKTHVADTQRFFRAVYGVT